VTNYTEWLAALATLRQGLAQLAAQATTLEALPEMTAAEADAVRRELADAFGLGEAVVATGLDFGVQVAGLLKEPLGHAETIKQALSRHTEAGLRKASDFLARQGPARGVVAFDDIPRQSRRLVDVDNCEDRQRLLIDVRFLDGELAQALAGVPRWQRNWVCYGPARPRWGDHVEAQPVWERPPRHVRHIDSANPIRACAWVGVDLIGQRTRELCERYPDGQPLPPALRLG
jgi:hypothetical protein